MKIVFLLYDKMTALDLVGPHEILSRLPNAEVVRASLKKAAVLTDSGLVLLADAALADVKQADILLIPGAGNGTSLRSYPEILKWIKEINQKTKWTTSVCTGSLILGAAGLLKGVKATTHWSTMEQLSFWKALPTEARVVEDGKFITAAGVSAGIDMALILCEKIAGIKFAMSMELALEYDPKPPFNTGSPKKAPKEIFLSVKEKMDAALE